MHYHVHNQLNVTLSRDGQLRRRSFLRCLPAAALAAGIDLDQAAALANVARSGAKWLLTTSFSSIKRNDDIVTGQWRPLNLTRPPFNLPEPAKRIAENCTETEFADKVLGVWPIADLPQAGCS